MADERQGSIQQAGQRRGSRRVTRVVVLSIVVLLLLLMLIAQGGFNLSPLLSPDSNAETLLLYALSTLNFLAFVTVLFILLRNVVKLGRERQANKPGSKFKTRLAGYAIGLSLLPALLLFFFAFGLLNRSIDRWFGEPARQIVDDARAIEEDYFRKEQQELADTARLIARRLSIDTREDFSSPDFESQLQSEMSQFRIASVRVLARKQAVTLPGASQAGRDSQGDRVDEALAAAEQRLRSGEDQVLISHQSASSSSVYMIAGLPLTNGVGEPRIVIVAQQFPPELTERASRISEQHQKFHGLLQKIKRIKAVYILLLGAVTLLLIFSATWLALYVARGITIPIQALAEATERVAHGDFSKPVEASAEDELAVLVKSFNDMSSMLAENRRKLEQAADDLKRTNLALEDRRRYIETILESLSTGVISTDSKLGIATINRSALWILGLKEKPEVGTPISTILRESEANEVAALCRRAKRTEGSHSELEIVRPDGSSVVTATAAVALRDSENTVRGWVIVIEDLTDLIQAERAAAWSEVARRMAHEIKNPLTPIQLSAERIRRNYDRAAAISPAAAPLDKVIQEGTSTIVREVAALQRMVEEFSRFARLPESHPCATQLNRVIGEALGLYTDRLNGITIQCDLVEELPLLWLDPAQMKQALVNLIDNAIEALNTDSRNGGNGARKLIRIESRYLKDNDIVRLSVSDTGHGIRPRDRDKLFLPKFSTRDRGTGLGLAIVSHIIADHNGRIWVEDNSPRGARFIIELPATRAE